MKNGTCWTDDSGKFIQAHGGCIRRFGDKWYWYGENKDAPNCIKPDGTPAGRVDVIGISCYTSADLHSWHYEGLALKGEKTGFLAPENVCERPKVIYSRKTGKYVMWFHCDRSDYTLAGAGCAVADRPEGPFTFLGVEIPNRRDCRDMTIFEDPSDGRAFLVHSGDWNKTLYLSEFNEERTGFTGSCVALLPEQEREAPAIWLDKGIYYIFTSGCTGWDPNPALYAKSSRLETVFRLIDNPCEGEGRHTTFNGQCACMFENEGQVYIVLDHWKRFDLRHSGYSILPVRFEGGAMTVEWKDEF